MTTAVALRLEKSFLPPEDPVIWNGGRARELVLSTVEKIEHYIYHLLAAVGYLLILPLAGIYSLVDRMIENVEPKKSWPDRGLMDPAVLPAHYGFADSLFQTSGLGTAHSKPPLPGRSDWHDWLNPLKIEGGDQDYGKFFIDVVGDPDPFIQGLKAMHSTAYRFSLEWAVIEPEKGIFDREAISLYKNFIAKLKENEIEPYVTIHHFVEPEWFGGFDDLENVEVFKNHAIYMMALFPEVTHWIPFNEINVDAFQKKTRGVYPPGEVGNLAGTGRLMRGMLVAHCKIYQEAKRRWPNHQIGSTHQWLKFEPLEGNFLEKIICYFLSKITHYACYNFFKTGQFSLEIPFMANVQFSIPEEEFKENRGFSDFIGVQFYGFPRLKAGLNSGHEYPGYKTINVGPFTFGSTCQEGGKMMSFGPSFYPESFEECLDEALALEKDIVISETGADARVQNWGEREFRIDEQSQREFYEKIFPILKKAKERLKAFFAWTYVRGHLEWDRGNFPCLGLVDQGRITPAGLYLQQVYQFKGGED